MPLPSAQLVSRAVSRAHGAGPWAWRGGARLRLREWVGRARAACAAACFRACARAQEDALEAFNAAGGVETKEQQAEVPAPSAAPSADGPDEMKTDPEEAAAPPAPADGPTESGPKGELEGLEGGLGHEGTELDAVLGDSALPKEEPEALMA